MEKKIFFIFIVLFFSWSKDVKADEYIRDWLVLGPFAAKTGEESLSFPYLENEAEIYGWGGQKVNGRQWIHYHAPNKILDFSEATLKFPFLEQQVAYTQVFIYSPDLQPVQCFLGSDDEVAIWCNQELIHYNWIQREHKFNNDTIRFQVNRGWNRLLFKVANGALSWKLSARFISPTAIHIQAQNPFPLPAKFVTNSNLCIWKVEPELISVLNAKNQPQIQLSFTIFNDGTVEAENIAVKLENSHHFTMKLPGIPKISGGELFNYQTRIQYHLLDSLVLTSAPPRICFNTTVQQFQEPLPIFSIYEALRTFFSPWQIEGWQYQQENIGIIFQKNLILPDIFKGFEVKFFGDLGYHTGDCSINGKSLRTNCQGFTGYYSLRKSGTNASDFLLALTLHNMQAEEKNIMDMPFDSRIVPIFPGIENYLFENRYAAEIFNHQISCTPEFEHQLYQAFRSYNFRLLSELLGELAERQSILTKVADSLTLRLISISRQAIIKPEPVIQSDDPWLDQFRLIIENLDNYPQFSFTGGDAYAFWLIEQYRPEIFSQFQKFIKKGQWEVIGGTWVEPALALINGESLIRQFLYGKNYFKEKFNLDIMIGWMPNNISYPITLPQILQNSGVKILPLFNTEAINDVRIWECPEGSRVLGHFLSPRNILNKVDDSIGKGIQRLASPGAIESPRFFGISPEAKSDFRRDIEKILQLDQLKIYPQVKMGRLDDYYQASLPLAIDSVLALTSLPVLNREIPFAHQGCWTSQAKMKWHNRRAETFLPIAEMFAWLASHFRYTYPISQLHESWRRLLANQEYELLAGMASSTAYQAAQKSYQQIFETTNQILREALGTLAANINTQFSEREALPLIVFNSLNWSRSGSLEIAVSPEPGMNQIEIFDSDGLAVPIKITNRQGGLIRFVFLAKDVPEMGYRTYWVIQHQGTEPEPIQRSPRFNFENDFLKISIDEQTGTIKEFFDKKLNHDLIRGGGAEFQIQTDRPVTLPIQNLGLIGPIIKLNTPTHIDVIEDNLIRKIIRVEYQYQNSILIQNYIFYKELSWLEVQVAVNWQEQQKMLKIAFPIQISNPTASFDVPFGIVTRPRNGQEVLAQKWCDLSNKELGLTIINDCKYGFDVKGNTIRMSVLRSPVVADSALDQGFHSFSYTLSPHLNDCKKGNSIQQGLNFNVPLVYLFTNMHKGVYPPASSFMKIDPDQIILSALKKAHNSEKTILRVYESLGEKVAAKITFPRLARSVSLTDLLEWSNEKLAQRGSEINFQINPYQIKTFHIEF
ncbi:alpha-mannosidase [candidate division KSB1 bacterium]|nr:alpha-mannosidase [candidate division KSB1 bacterium]